MFAKTHTRCLLAFFTMTLFVASVGCGGDACQDVCMMGANQCQGNSLMSCGDYDGDGCMEWGDPFTCPDECLLDRCVSSCENECQNGTRRCAGDQYQLCGDSNGDGCTEWSNSQSCLPGQVCQGAGLCVDDCQDRCAENESQCVSGQPTQVQACACPETGCCDWAAATECPAGQSCANGVCVTCTNECSPAGKKECVDGTSFRTCGDLDDDPCNEWSAATVCDGALVCYNGSCIEACTDDCDGLKMGERVCTADDRGFRTCGDYDTDPCLELGNATACGANERCEQGVCIFDCVDECYAGERRCLQNGYQICGQHDEDPCTDWGPVTDCKYNETCSLGVCSVSCQPECDRGDTECSGFQSVRSCGEYDQDPCADWGEPSQCNLWERCVVDVNGVAGCHIICFNECDVPGATQCSGDGFLECGDYDWDACLEWSDLQPCGADELCSDGQCSTRPCTHDCDVEGFTECFGESGYRICGQYDSDTCLDWSSSVPCGADQRCSNGQCVYFCEDACQQNEMGCVQNHPEQSWFCSDEDGDGCLDVVAVNCMSGHLCSDGVCYLSCTTDPDCPSGTSCQSSLCKPYQCNDDDFEENDTALTAASIAGDQIDLQICSRDEDWYLVHVNAGDGLRLTLYFDGLAGDLDLELFDADDSTTPISGSYGIDDSETVTAEAIWGEADYLVRVFGYGGAANVYDMEVNFVSSGTCMDDVFEPNDSIDTAEFVLDGLYPGLVLCAGNEDWYENYMFAGEDLIVDLTFVHGNGDLDVVITGDAGGGLLWGDSEDDNESISYSIPSDGYYYVWVYGYEDAENVYDMSIDYGAFCWDDNMEPNDTRATAFPVTDRTYDDLMLCSGDVDWYSVEVGANAEIMAAIDFTNAAGDLDLELLDENGQVLNGSYSYGDSEVVGMAGLDAGTYYILVYGWEGAENSYSMEVVY
ncbi:MAG: PPC domain-containing protein [Deltaproteobacteria bacterium]|nr:PPC domain-containing protein [Deltaproteobacteria bacterium]